MANICSQEEASLVCRARKGDQVAFDQLVARYRAPLLALAFLRTGHHDEADDLVQEIFEKAWRKLPALREEGAFTPWLKTIAANTCNSWHRRARPLTCSLEDDATSLNHGFEGSPIEVVLQREAERALREALATLPHANCLALLMRVWGGHSYQEIADFTGVEPKTVEGRIRRARLQLRHLLVDPQGDSYGEPDQSKSK